MSRQLKLSLKSEFLTGCENRSGFDEVSKDLKPGVCRDSHNLSFRSEFLRRNDELYAPLQQSGTCRTVQNTIPHVKMNCNVVVSSRNRELVSRSMMIKAKNTIIMKERNLDHCEVDTWWFDPCLLCWTSGRVSAGHHEKGRPDSHMKRVITVQEEPSLHVNSTRERCPGLNPNTMETFRYVNLFKKFKTACPRMSRTGKRCMSLLTATSEVRVPVERATCPTMCGVT